MLNLFSDIYNGQINLDAKNMAAFIDACNLLHLKATISCEKKLVFDTDSGSTSTIKIQPVITQIEQVVTSKQNRLDSIMAELDHDDIDDDIEEQNVEYHLKEETDMNESGQLLEVYEIANIEEAEIYEQEDEEMSEDQYELLNILPDEKEDISEGRRVVTKRFKTSPDSKGRNTAKQVDDATMTQAISEIFNSGLSFGAASDKFQIPKTLLWRRAKKLGYVKSERPKDSTRVQAIEAIKQGDSLISLSKRFNIPISTLHREKLKLYEKGQLPDNVNLRNRSR